MVRLHGADTIPASNVWPLFSNEVTQIADRPLLATVTRPRVAALRILSIRFAVQFVRLYLLLAPFTLGTRYPIACWRWIHGGD